MVNKNIKPAGDLPVQRKLASYQFEDICYNYLDKITKLCKDNGIQLVLIKAPSLYPYWYDEYDEQMKKYAEENDVDYYNLKNYVD